MFSHDILLCTIVIVSFIAQDGITSLDIASERGHTEVVDVLLKHGADPNLACRVCRVVTLFFFVHVYNVMFGLDQCYSSDSTQKIPNIVVQQICVPIEGWRLLLVHFLTHSGHISFRCLPIVYPWRELLRKATHRQLRNC